MELLSCILNYHNNEYKSMFLICVNIHHGFSSSRRRTYRRRRPTSTNNMCCKDCKLRDVNPHTRLTNIVRRLCMLYLSHAGGRTRSVRDLILDHRTPAKALRARTAKPGAKPQPPVPPPPVPQHPAPPLPPPLSHKGGETPSDHVAAPS